MASEYLQWKYRDVKPDEKIQLTPRQRRQNWWHYHWMWVLLTLVLLLAGADLARSVLGLGQIHPDYQVAVVAPAPLSQESLDAVKTALAGLGQDCNGDGRVLVGMNTYYDMSVSQDSDAAHYAAAAQVRLMADMESCESYFFLLSDPEKLQSDYQILARADGVLAASEEETGILPLEKISALAPLLESCPDLAGFALARRGFWQDRTCANREACDALWNLLTKEALP